MRLLITGVTGKVGLNFLPNFLSSACFRDWDIVVVCNNRRIPDHDRVEIIQGSISDPTVVHKAMDGTTHVVHLAAVKESVDLAIDVSIKGLFLLLEAARYSQAFKQFILLSGDCTVGHMFQNYQKPIVETSPRRAYHGCYALTKALEEEMLAQYQHQYDLNGCCLRAPWIMEKDDFRYAMTFGDQQFGGPKWSDLIPKTEEAECVERNLVPLLKDHEGAPLLRNFIHVNDVVDAIMRALDNSAAKQQLFNISMNEPVSYAKMTYLLKQVRDLDHIEINTPFFGNWLDNSKARKLLNWEPLVDLHELVDLAWNYARHESESRIIWYPG